MSRSKCGAAYVCYSTAVQYLHVLLDPELYFALRISGLIRTKIKK